MASLHQVHSESQQETHGSLDMLCIWLTQSQQAKENQASTSKHPNQDPLAIGHTSHMTNPNVYPTISHIAPMIYWETVQTCKFKANSLLPQTRESFSVNVLFSPTTV